MENLRCGQHVKVLSNCHTESITFQLSKTVHSASTIQFQQSLVPGSNSFQLEIKQKSMNSILSFGLASSEIKDGVHVGKWPRSVGYHSNTGFCFSSHNHSANTDGVPYNTGDLVSLVLTHFSSDLCTVVFLRNKQPVATRYLFNPHVDEIFPTICIENGPLSINVTWPNHFRNIPDLTMNNLSDWIRPEGLSISANGAISLAKSAKQSLITQSSVPFSFAQAYIEVSVDNVSSQASAPVLGLCSCSPLYPTPTSTLCRDFLYWSPSAQGMICQPKSCLGIGIHYSPSASTTATFSDKDSQLILVYLTFDGSIVWYRLQNHPTGGLFPIISPTCVNYSAVIKTDPKTTDCVIKKSELDRLFNLLLSDALLEVTRNNCARQLSASNIRSTPGIDISIGDNFCRLAVSSAHREPQIIQYNIPLTDNVNSYFMEIKKLSNTSDICVGVSNKQDSLHKVPGKDYIHSVGWSSQEGTIYSDKDPVGNTKGCVFTEGDIVGLTVMACSQNISVVMFTKNSCPVGTRYMSHESANDVLPTISITTYNEEVILDVMWNNRVGSCQTYVPWNVEHWCLPNSCSIGTDGFVHFYHSDEQRTMQAPRPLNNYDWNHFELILTDKFSEDVPPPAIALCSAGYDSTLSLQSSFCQNFIQFSPVGSAASTVRIGDRMGWGIYYPPSNLARKDNLIIVYLTINTAVALIRVLVEPHGGFYPLIIIPSKVMRIKLDFRSMYVTKHPFSKDVVSALLQEARETMQAEFSSALPFDKTYLQHSGSKQSHNKHSYADPMNSNFSSKSISSVSNPPSSIQTTASSNQKFHAYNIKPVNIGSDKLNISGINFGSSTSDYQSDVDNSGVESTRRNSRSSDFHSLSSPNLQLSSEEIARENTDSPPFVLTTKPGFMKFSESHVHKVSKHKKTKSHKRSKSMSNMEMTVDQSGSRSCIVL